MRILGVDPGSARTGWGLVGGTAGRPVLVECGRIELRGPLSFPGKLHRLREELDDLVKRLRPSAAAVEAPFQGVNARAAFQLAHARGVILAVLGGACVSVVEYTPATVKKAVTGNGRADKEQVRSMVARVLGYRGQLEPADVTDALAVAFCHASSLGLRARIAAADRAAPRPSRARARRV